MKFNQGGRSKEETLLQLIDLLVDEQVPYAIIGGVALQVHTSDPRTTVDIDVAVPEIADIPAAALEKRGFKRTGTFDFSDNWVSPDGIAVQFSSGRAWPGMVARSEVHSAFGKPVRFLCALDLVRAKLEAASEPRRRRSKAHQDAVDVEVLLEEHPDILAQLTDDERNLVDKLTRRPE